MRHSEASITLRLPTELHSQSERATQDCMVHMSHQFQGITPFRAGVHFDYEPVCADGQRCPLEQRLGRAAEERKDQYNLGKCRLITPEQISEMLRLYSDNYGDWSSRPEMPFNEATKVMLYARSGNRCAFPECQVGKLVFVLKGTSKRVNHGKASHIVAESEDGPRGKSHLSKEKRNSFENGIILCTNHHNDVVDKFPEKYPASLLQNWKRQQERTASQRINQKKLADDAILASYVDEWVRRSFLGDWRNWTHPLLRGGSQCLRQDVHDSLQELSTWLGARIWPPRYLKVEQVFRNFQNVFTDFLVVFHRYADWKPFKVPVWCTEKFYRRTYPTHNRLIVERAVQEYYYHVALVEDLLLELTRAANLVCLRIREEFDASFWLEEGRISAISGPYEDDSICTHFPEYRGRELRKRMPYPGLLKFMVIRGKRDIQFGKGVRTAYLKPKK